MAQWLERVLQIMRSLVNALYRGFWCDSRRNLGVITSIPGNSSKNHPTHVGQDTRHSGWRADSSLKWPNIPCPPKSWWAVFRRFIRQAFTNINRPGRLHAPVSLNNKLGNWHEVPRHIKHQYYRTSTTAYNRNGSAFLTYTAVNNIMSSIAMEKQPNYPIMQFQSKPAIQSSNYIQWNNIAYYQLHQHHPLHESNQFNK